MPSLSPIEVQKKIGTIQGELPRRGAPNTLSVCMIVKNEESNIERAIRSFLPFADEIIVNDTGSTDRTLEILAGLPKVKVIHSEWKRDFSYSRNLSLDAATCAWCLWMDADDVVPPDQVANFNKLKRAPLDRAFGFIVVNTQGGGQAVGAHFVQVRMFPNHASLRFERRIHEQIVYAVANLGLHIFYLDAKILHLGYEDDAVRMAKSERNLELILTEPDRGIDPVISCQLGDAYMILGRLPEAIAAYREVFAIPNAEEINRDAYREVFVNIGKALMQMADYEHALEMLKTAESHSPDRLDPIFYQGECQFQAKRYHEARSLFERALTLKQTHSSQASHFDVMRMYSFKYLCDIASMEKQPEVLLKWGHAFQEEYPQVIEAGVAVGKAHLLLGHIPQAITTLEKTIATNPTASREAWFALMHAYEKAGTPERIGPARKKMAEAFGEPILGGDSPLLSIAMIVKNEESHLQACLDSVRGLWDDLVIVDTGSTDRTIAIAEGAGARVFHFPWIGDFSAARNRSLEECRGRWILWIDADDIFLAEDRIQIRKLVEGSEPRKAYGLLVKSSQDGGVTGSVFNQIRIFPNHKEIRFTGRVHEQVTPALQTLGLPVEFLPLRVIHTGYTDPETIKAKQRRNLELMMADLEANPRAANAMKFFAIGNAHLDLGDFSQAADWYRKSMQQAERIGEDRHILEILPVKLAECSANQGDKQGALRMMEAFMARYPMQPNGLYLLAQLHESLGKADLASDDFGYLMYFQEQPTLMPVDFQQIRIRACKYLADYWLKRGNQQLALEILRTGIAVGKGQTTAGLKLASLYFEHEQYQACQKLLDFARGFGDTPQILHSLGQVRILLDDVSGALSILQEGAKKFPSDSLILQLLSDLKADLGQS